MSVDKTSQWSQVPSKMLLWVHELLGDCHLPLCGAAPSPKSGLVCFGDGTFFFSHTVLHPCLAGVIIRFSSWTSKKLLQGWRWALKSQDMNCKHLTQQSPAAEGQMRESRPWDLRGSAMVAWPVQDSWVGFRTRVCTPRQSSFPAPLVIINCKY